MDLLIHNGNVLTIENGGRAEAVGVTGGRITHVGGSDDLMAQSLPATKRIDLGGRTLTPGFEDAHAHIWKIGHLLTTMLDLRQVRSIVELEGKLRERDAVLPQGVWLLGRGFNEALLAEKRRPTRIDLDRASTSRPIVLTRACGHIYAVNSVALRLAGVTAETVPPTGGVIECDDAGAPNGILHETAMGLIQKVLPPPTSADYEAMITAALQHQLTHGITASSNCGVNPELLAVYREMDRRNLLPARMNVMPLRRVDGVDHALPLPQQWHSEFLRVDTVKFLADGGLSGATAALSQPYRNNPSSSSQGVLRFDRAELYALCREAHDAGWRIATHAIGDVAIGQVLDIYEDIYERTASQPSRLAHRIEHFGLPTPADVRRAARLGIIAAPQTIFLHALGQNFLEVLPKDMVARSYPVRDMLEHGMTVALSSDAPVVEDDSPLMGMQSAVLRQCRDGQQIAPEQSITIEQALYAYTMGGAIAAGASATRGSIRAGKWADFAVLTGDPLTTAPELLGAIHVDMTFVAGCKVYER